MPMPHVVFPSHSALVEKMIHKLIARRKWILKNNMKAKAFLVDDNHDLIEEAEYFK